MWIRRISFLAAIAIFLPVLVSCSESGPPRVTVKGKITYAGGNWPKPATLDFAAETPAEGMPNLPASAETKDDGSFEVQLVPGKYVVNITCWEVEMQPDNPNSGKSYIPQRYHQPGPDRLTIDVPLGSKGPIIANFDIAKQ